MKNYFVNMVSRIVVAVFVCVGLWSLKSEEIPSPHERAIDLMLKGYQKEVNLLVPILAKDPTNKKAKDFVELFFTSDTSLVVNHLLPGDIKTDKKLETIAGKNFIAPLDFLKLSSGVYKNTFKYQLSRDEMEILSLDSTTADQRLLHRYKVTIPVTIHGRPNAQLNVEVQDTLSFVAVVYSDTKRNVRYAKIEQIVRKGTSLPIVIMKKDTIVPEPKPVVKPVEVIVPVIDWTAEKKVQRFVEYIETLKQASLSAVALEQLEEESAILFDESGFVTIISKEGTPQQLTKEAFFRKVREKKTSYQLKSVDISFYDEFRKNDYNKWFNRITTFHGVEKFDKGVPVTTQITSAQRMPAPGKCISGIGSYYQLSQVILKEL